MPPRFFYSGGSSPLTATAGQTNLRDAVGSPKSIGCSQLCVGEGDDLLTATQRQYKPVHIGHTITACASSAHLLPVTENGVARGTFYPLNQDKSRQKQIGTTKRWIALDHFKGLDRVRVLVRAMNASTHPDREELEGYVLSTLPKDRAERLEKHLQACPACEEQIRDMEHPSDPLIQSPSRRGDRAARSRADCFRPLAARR